MKCSIDSNTREIIFLDNSECFGVEFDKNTQRIEFSCPKIVGDNLDLTKCICRINYMNAKGYRDSYLIDDILVDGDNITFTWTLSSKVTAGRGNCLFIFCSRQVNENGVIEKEWNTTVAKASIKRGLETNSHIEDEYSDILESILSRLDKLENTEVETVKDWFENDTNSPKYIENRPGGYYIYEDEVIGSCNEPINEINKKYTVFLNTNMGIKFENEEITLKTGLRIYDSFDEETGEPLNYHDICVSTNTLKLVDTKTEHIQTGPSTWGDMTTYYYECETDWYKIYREYQFITTDSRTNDKYSVEFTTEVENMNDGQFIFSRTVEKLKQIPNIANGNFIINIDTRRRYDIADGIYATVDKTYSEIKYAVDDGLVIQCIVRENGAPIRFGYNATIYGLDGTNVYLKISSPSSATDHATDIYHIISIGSNNKIKVEGPYYTLCLIKPRNNKDRKNLLQFNDFNSSSNSYEYSCRFATPNVDYMTPSLGMVGTNIEVGDILCVKSLVNSPTSSSSKQPSGWTIRKVDAEITADSENLVTSNAVYNAIQNAISNLKAELSKT